MLPEESFLEILEEHLSSDKTILLSFDRTGLNIQQELTKEDPDLRQIERLITRDQALTSQVLRTSNSAFFKGLSKVSTIHEAIVRLGTMEVGNIITMVLHGRNFNSEIPFFRDIMAKLWKHSVGCAIGSQWLAKECGFQSITNEAFIAGLLHDVGKLFLLTVIEKIKTAGKLMVQPSAVLINQVMETLHMEQGYTLMTNWNLPESYCIIARDHHLESVNPDDNLLTLVKMANKACNKIGIGSTKNGSLMLAATPEAHHLGLSEVSIAKLEIKLEDSLHLCQ